MVESIWSRATGEQAVAVSTSRLHNIAGKYTGKDDPVMLVRVQKNFPATGEILAPYAIGHLRGGLHARLAPDAADAGAAATSGISYFDGPPIGELRAPLPCTTASSPNRWTSSRIRSGTRCAIQVADKAIAMRRQGFFGAAMLPMSELEYTGIMEKLHAMDARFRVRKVEAPKAA